MKKSLAFGLLFAASFTVFAQGPRGGFGPMGRGMGGSMGGSMGGAGLFGVGPQTLVTGAPYSALEVVQTTETLADGNRISNQRQTTVYRDGQGRIRTEETITPPAGSGKQPYTVATILDYVAGFRYVLDSSTMTAYQSPLHTPRGQGFNRTAPRTRQGGPRSVEASQNRPQVVSSALAPQSVNGLLATGTQHTETIPAGAIGNTQPIQTSRTVWMSNDLKVPVQIRSSDPRFGTTSMDLTNIVQAEPSGSLFVLSAGYAVKTGGPAPMARGPRNR